MTQTLIKSASFSLLLLFYFMEEWEKALLGIGCYIGAVIICNSATFCNDGFRNFLIQDFESKEGRKDKMFRCFANWARCVGSIKEACFKSKNQVHPEPNNQEADIENQRSHQNSLPPEGYLHNLQILIQRDDLSSQTNLQSVSFYLERNNQNNENENVIENKTERVFSDNVLSANNLIERNSNTDENAIGRLRTAQIQIQNNRGLIEAGFRRPSSVQQERQRQINSVEEVSELSI